MSKGVPIPPSLKELLRFDKSIELMLTPFSFLIVHKTYFLKKLWSPPKLFNMLGAFPARKSSFFTVEILPYDAMTT